MVIPDEWQLGSRMLMDIGFAQQLLNKQGQLSYNSDSEAALASLIPSSGTRSQCPAV